MARRALLVGIDNYERSDMPRLRGCVNDIVKVRDVLKNEFGFATADIRVLVDDRATRAAIVHRLEWLVAEARRGDLLVFQFSGHGSQIRDRNGDELDDNLDELICPFDLDWDDTFITDDNLDAIFKAVPEGACLEVFLDTCFAGTGLREVGMGVPPGERPQDSQVRFAAPPVDIAARIDETGEGLSRKRVGECLAQEGGRVLWAATAEGGTSNEAYIEGAFHGVFTYYLWSYLQESAGEASREELLLAVADALAQEDYNQIPQLESEVSFRVAWPLGAQTRLAWTPFDL